jgi:hypothetical protein
MSDDSQLDGPPRPIRQRRLPSLSMPSMPRVERSPTVPQRGYPDDVSFPRLATSPTLPPVAFNDYYAAVAQGGRYAPPPPPVIYPHRPPPGYNGYADASMVYGDGAMPRTRVIQAQPGNIPLSDSEPEAEWAMV